MSSPAAQADLHDRSRRPLEIRLALAMSGGVGLAVWMGGVTVELLRLVRADGRTVFGRLLQELNAIATIDVIAGVSAGGLNGAFLAYALANDVASLTGLRDVWIDEGSLGILLRSPLERDAPSLLSGDAEFLPRLERALANLPRGRDPITHDLDLFIGASLLQPVPLRFLDSLGSWLYEADHRGLFHFRHVPDVHRHRTDDPAHLRDGVGSVLPQLLNVDAVAGLVEPGSDRGSSPVVRRLALAIRSSASFPGAFEASFVPVGTTGDDPGHPDMKGVLQGSHPGSPPVESSRFVVDGGALRNKPIEPALEAIFAKPADRNVRRILVFIDPDPAAESGEPLKPEAAPPSLGEVVLQSAVVMPRNQMVGDDIAAIGRHNERARQSSIFRRASGFERVGNTSLIGMARRLLESYVETRAAASAEQTLKTVLQHLAVSDRGATGPMKFTHEALRASLVSERRKYLPRINVRAFSFPSITATFLSEIALLPPSLPTSVWPAEREALGWQDVLALRHQAILTAARQLLPSFLVSTPEEPLDRFWSWGIATVGRFGTEILAAVKAAMEDLARQGGDPVGHFAWNPLAALRRHVHGILQEVRNARSTDAEYWRAAARRLEQTTSTDEWARLTYERWPTGKDDSARESAGLQIWLAYLAALCAQSAIDLGDVFHEASFEVDAGFELSTRLVERLLPSRPSRLRARDSVWERSFERLAAFEVIRVGGGADVHGPEQPVELVQFSSHSIDPIRGETDSRRKVTSIQLGHFGAFYKASWRANDFMWGRVDGTTQLARLLIDGGGLVQKGDTPQDVKDRVGRSLCPDYHPGWSGPPDLRDDWAAACREIDHLMTPPRPTPASAVAFSSQRRFLKTGDLLAKAAILEYLPAELRAVAKAVRRDEEMGADSARGRELASTVEALLPPMPGEPSAHPPSERRAAQEAFRSCRIGEDRIKDDLGSDYLTRIATQSGAVAISALGSVFARAKWFGKLLARTVRGAFLTTHLMAEAALGGGKRLAGPVAVVAVYAAAALLLGWAISDKPPAGVPPAAAVVTIGAMVFAVARNWWTRSRRWRMVVCLGMTITACVAAGALPWIGDLIWRPDGAGVSRVPAVFAFFRDQRAFVITGILLAGLLTLGTITVRPRPTSPLPAAADRHPSADTDPQSEAYC